MTEMLGGTIEKARPDLKEYEWQRLFDAELCQSKVDLYTGCFFSLGLPLKKLKYGKLRLG